MCKEHKFVQCIYEIEVCISLPQCPCVLQFSNNDDDDVHMVKKRVKNEVMESENNTVQMEDSAFQECQSVVKVYTTSDKKHSMTHCYMFSIAFFPFSFSTAFCPYVCIL